MTRAHNYKYGGSILILLFLVALFPLGTGQAHATESRLSRIKIHEIRMGIMAHDKDHMWSGSRLEGGTDYNAEIVFSNPSYTLPRAGWGTIRPNFGVTINSEDGTSKAYTGIDWNIDLSKWFFLNLGADLAIHNGNLDDRNIDKKMLGSRILFRTMIELGVKIYEKHRVSIAFDHISNASLAIPNDGLDTLGLRYSYRF